MREALNHNRILSINNSEYRNFFAAHQLVVSSPGGFILAGSNTHFLNKIAIHQRVPLRNYLGVRLTAKKGVFLESVKNYDLLTEKFTDQEAVGYYTVLAEFLEKQLAKFNFDFGLIISCLNEIPRRNGLNNPGSYAANITGTFLLLTNQIKINDLGQKEYDSENPVIVCGKEFHKKLNTINASGFGCLSSFPQTCLPIVFSPSGIMALESLINNKTRMDYPIDMIVIGTNDVGNIDFPLSDYQKKASMNYRFSGSSDHISSQELTGENITSSKIGNKYIKKQYLNASNASTIQAIFSICDAFRDPSRDSINRLLRSLNNTFITQDLTGNPFYSKSLIYSIVSYYFATQLKNIPYTIITSIANHLVVCVPRDAIRTKADNLISFIRQNIDRNITVPYISWIDGYDNLGTNVEQWIDKKIRSYIFPENSQVVRYYPRISSDYIIESDEYMDRKIANTNIFVDTDSNKIYIHGNKVDSSTLPSSTATVNLLVRLLSHPERKIHVSKLPKTSYYQDRNELQSKILTPLKKGVLQHLNKDLSICSKGTLTNYSVVLKDCDLSIRVLTRK